MAHRPFELHGQSLHDLFLPHGKPCPEQSRPFVLTATIVASALAFIDSTLVGIAVPAMQVEFNATILDLQWVVNSYALMLGALILVGGGLGDRLGRRRVFVTGILIFTVASVLCALAGSVLMLIWARALQGIGAALLVPQSLALISANFPKDVRGKAIGTWAAASAVTTAIGPPIGGFLIDTMSWRAAFWINVPLAAVALWLTWVHMSESRDESADGPVDWTGAAIAVAAFGALTWGLSLMADPEAPAVQVWLWIVAGLIGIGAFLFAEARVKGPLMPLDLFRSKVFTGVNIATVFLYGALTGVLFLVPFDLIARRGMSAAEAGLIMLPFGLIIGIASRYTGDLADTYGPRRFLVGGPLMVALGAAWLALGMDNMLIGVFIPIIILSSGMAIVVSPLTTAVMSAAPEEKAGAASGISNTASRLSGVIAIAVFGGVAGLVFSWTAPPDSTFGLVPAPGEPGRVEIEAAFLAAYNAALMFAAVWCVAASVVSWFSLAGTGPTKPKQGSEPAEQAA